jgi:hypothetical protein
MMPQVTQPGGAAAASRCSARTPLAERYSHGIAKVGFCTKPGLGNWAWLPALGFLRSFEPNRNIPGSGRRGQEAGSWRLLKFEAVPGLAAF